MNREAKKTYIEGATPDFFSEKTPDLLSYDNKESAQAVVDHLNASLEKTDVPYKSRVLEKEGTFYIEIPNFTFTKTSSLELGNTTNKVTDIKKEVPNSENTSPEKNEIQKMDRKIPFEKIGDTAEELNNNK